MKDTIKVDTKRMTKYCQYELCCVQRCCLLPTIKSCVSETQCNQKLSNKDRKPQSIDIYTAINNVYLTCAKNKLLFSHNKKFMWKHRTPPGKSLPKTF